MKRLQPKQFELKPEHLKLLGHAYTNWQDCETGAPEIDPKRPYGNSDVPDDVGEILGWNKEGNDGEEESLSRHQREVAIDLHRETEIALQIILSEVSKGRKVKTGIYQRTNEGDFAQYERSRWELNT